MYSIWSVAPNVHMATGGDHDHPIIYSIFNKAWRLRGEGEGVGFLFSEYLVGGKHGQKVCMYLWSSVIAEYGSTGFKVANPARGQLKRENGYFPVPVRA